MKYVSSVQTVWPFGLLLQSMSVLYRLCGLLDCRYKGSSCLHLLRQSRRWRRHIPPTRWQCHNSEYHELNTQWHDVTPCLIPPILGVGSEDSCLIAPVIIIWDGACVNVRLTVEHELKNCQKTEQIVNSCLNVTHCLQNLTWSWSTVGTA